MQEASFRWLYVLEFTRVQGIVTDYQTHLAARGASVEWAALAAPSPAGGIELPSDGDLWKTFELRTPWTDPRSSCAFAICSGSPSGTLSVCK